VLDEIALRLLVAVGLAALVGAEREASRQPAGLRTHVSVAIGACLFGIISTLGFLEFKAVRATSNIQVDVTRVASNVVVGIGFLGAGLIFRQGGHVRNLTTAASLWAVAAIGLAAGVGNPGAAALATFALLATLVLLRPVRALIEQRLVRPSRRVTVVLAAEGDPGLVVAALTGPSGLTVEEVTIRKEDGRPVLRAELRGPRGADLDTPISELASRVDVYTVLEGDPG
jgi:putative Mg2+ transporter-C (MgtC) family protein